jgi:hypothetical protein
MCSPWRAVMRGRHMQLKWIGSKDSVFYCGGCDGWAKKKAVRIRLTAFGSNRL